MGKGFGGGFPGGNLGNLMKQAQKMQQEMMKVQEELQEKTFDASAGGGTVKVIVSGKKEIKEITISPEVAEDIEMLQDLLIVAINEALRKAEETMSSEMGKLTGGMNIPGF